MANIRYKRSEAVDEPGEDIPAAGRKVIRELFGLFLLFWGLLVLLALLTYSREDPGLNHVVSNPEPVRNAAGVFGAHIGGLLVDVFGIAALVWPAVFLAWGAGCVSSWFSMPWWRWLGFLTLGGCLISLGAALDFGLGDVRGGGMLGMTLYRTGVGLFSPAGSLLIWLFLLFLSLELAFGICWMSLLQRGWARLAAKAAEKNLTWARLFRRLPETVTRRVAPKTESGPVIPLLDIHTDEPLPGELFRVDDEPPAAVVEPAAVSSAAPAEVLPAAAPSDVFEDALPAGPNLAQPPAAPEPATIKTERKRPPHAAVPPPRTETTEFDGTEFDVVYGIPPELLEDHEDEPPAVRNGRPEVRPPVEAVPEAPQAPAVVVPEPAPAAGETPASASAFQSVSAGMGAAVAALSDVLRRTIRPDRPEEDLPEPEADAPELPAEAAAVPAPPVAVPPVRARLPMPSFDLLSPPKESDVPPPPELMEAKGEKLMACIANFGIQSELVRVTPGPVVTMFELRPAPGVRVTRIAGLNQDIALGLKAEAVRIQAPIPGHDTVGVEIPNETRATVNFREILESDVFRNADALLTMALGKDIGGMPVVADLAKMPHLLVAGATGAGKSVCLNALLLSLLYKADPDEMKLLLVDPKRIELAVYADLPHLVHPVVTDMALAKTALDWAVHEMDTRYTAMARVGARNLAGYNRKLKDMGAARPPELADLDILPYLVIVVDELADLMLTAGKDVETAIVRLAQLARAAGIHLVLATQRPSVDVVTGLIKANFPCRIAFQVSNKYDSRTILDSTGAELLLGRGDMLFKPSGGKLRRLHGAFVPDEDVCAVVEYWKRLRAPEYRVDFSEWGAPRNPSPDLVPAGAADEEEALYAEVVAFACAEGEKISISKLQRRFRIGFNKAARFVERMEQDGIITPPDRANRSRSIRRDDL